MSDTTQFLPSEGLLRLDQILGNPKASPPIPAIIPVSKSTWYAGQKVGRFPMPVTHLGKRTRAYRVEDIRGLIENGTFDASQSKQPSPEPGEQYSLRLTEKPNTPHAASNPDKSAPQPSNANHGSELASQEMTPSSTISQSDNAADSESPDGSPPPPPLWVVDGSDCEKLSVIAIATAIGLANGTNLLGREFHCLPRTVTFASEVISARRQTELLDRLHPTSEPDEESDYPGLVLLPRERLNGALLLDPLNVIRNQLPETTEVLIVDTKRGNKSPDAVDITMIENFASIAKRQLPRLKLVVLIARARISTCRSQTSSASERSRFLTLRCLNEVGALRYRLSIVAVRDSAGARPVQFELTCEKDRQSQRWNWSRTRL